MNARHLAFLAAAACLAAAAAAAPVEVAPPAGPLDAAGAALHAALSAALPGALPQAAIPGGDAAAVAVPAQAAAPSALATLGAQAAGAQDAARPGRSAEAGAAAGAPFDGAAKPAPGSLGEQDLPAFNAAMVEALKPCNNAATQASIVFRQAQTDDKGVTNVAVKIAYSKKGPQGEASLSIPAAYANHDNDPRTMARANLKFDLLRAYPQSEFNRMGPGADKFVAQLLEQYHRNYGDAAAIDARKTVEIRDPKTGDLKEVRVRVDLKVDLAKLPPTVKRDSVQYLEGHLDFDVNLNGVRASIHVAHNPEFASFRQGQTGLKEYLEALRAGSPEVLQSVAKLMSYVDSAATQITSSPRQPSAPPASAAAVSLVAAPAAKAAPDYPRTAWIEAVKQQYVMGHPVTDEAVMRSQLPAAARRAYDREHRARRRNGRRGQEVRAFIVEADGQRAYAVEAPGRRESHGYASVDLFDASGKLIASGAGREGAPMAWQPVFDWQAWIEAVRKTFKDEYDQSNALSFPTASWSEQPKAVRAQARRYKRLYGSESQVFKIDVDGRAAFIVYNQNGGGMWVKLFGPRGAELAEGSQGESGDFRW